MTTQLDLTSPAGTTVPEQSTGLRARRYALVAMPVLAGLCLTLAAAMDPAAGISGDKMFEAYAENPGPLQVKSLAYHWAYAFWIGIALVVASLVRRRGVWLANIAAVLAFSGMTTLPGMLFIDWIDSAAGQLWGTEGVNALHDRMEEISWGMPYFQVPGMLGFALALPLAAFALKRAGLVRWYAPAATLGALLAFMVSNATWPGCVVATACFAVLSAELWRGTRPARSTPAGCRGRPANPFPARGSPLTLALRVPTRRGSPMSPRASAAIPRLPLAVSLLALVVALSGTAVAAGLAANSVGTKQLKKAAVTTKKIKKKAVRTATIKNGAVTGAKVADGSLGKADLAPGVLPAAPVTIFHEIPEGTDVAAVTVGGVRFQPTCRVEPGVKIALFTIQPTAGTNSLSVQGVVVQSEGTTTLPNPIVGTGSNSFEPAAVATAGNNATTSFEGVARSGSGPWVQVSIGMRASTVQANCTLRAVVTVLG